MQCRVECAIGCSKQRSRVALVCANVPTRFKFWPDATVNFTCKKNTLWAKRDEPMMVSCQLPMIAYNLHLQAHTKLLPHLLALVLQDIYLEHILWPRTNPSEIILLKASTFVATTTRRVFACIVSPQDLNSSSRISNHTPMHFLFVILRAYYGALQSFLKI
jgi:hypothetical protein